MSGCFRRPVVIKQVLGASRRLELLSVVNGTKPVIPTEVSQPVEKLVMNTNTLSLKKNDVVSGVITASFEYGWMVTIKVGDKSVRALLVKNQVSGKDDASRDARIASLKMGDTIEGLVTRAELADAKNPGLKGKKVEQYAISERALISKRGRESREARESAENAILNDLTIGTAVQATIKEVRTGLGAFVVINGGVADGRRALIHVSQVCDDRSKDVRDARLAELVVGTDVTAEVTKVGRNDKQFLEIGLSLKSADQRDRAQAEAEEAAAVDEDLLNRFPVGCDMTARVVKATDDGIVLRVSQDGVEAVLVISGDMADKIMRAKSTRVRVLGAKDGRLQVEKA